MTRVDRIFKEKSARTHDFEFNDEVAEVFDDMIMRSVPFYIEQQQMMTEIARTFWVPNTSICDLGFSTATTLINMCREIRAC